MREGSFLGQITVSRYFSVLCRPPKLLHSLAQPSTPCVSVSCHRHRHHHRHRHRHHEDTEAQRNQMRLPVGPQASGGNGWKPISWLPRTGFSDLTQELHLFLFLPGGETSTKQIPNLLSAPMDHQCSIFQRQWRKRGSDQIEMVAAGFKVTSLLSPVTVPAAGGLCLSLREPCKTSGLWTLRASLCLSPGFPSWTLRKWVKVNFPASYTAPWAFWGCPLSGYQEGWESWSIWKRFQSCHSWEKGAGLIPTLRELGTWNQARNSQICPQFPCRPDVRACVRRGSKKQPEIKSKVRKRLPNVTCKTGFCLI